MSSKRATFGDLRKLQGLNNTLVRFDISLKVIREEKREELFAWLKKWTPRK